MSYSPPPPAPSPPYASLSPDDPRDRLPTSPALSTTIEPEEVQEPQDLSGMDDQQIVDRLIDSTGAEDVLLVLLYLDELKRRGKPRRVNWKHSVGDITVLSLAASVDSPANRMICQLLLLSEVYIPPELLRSNPYGPPLVTDWACKTFGLWLKKIELGFETARKLYEMGPWTAEDWMKANPDYLAAVWPRTDEIPIFLPNPAFIPRRARNQRFPGEDIKPNINQGKGGKITKSKKNKKKKGKYTMPPMGPTIARVSPSPPPGFGPPPRYLDDTPEPRQSRPCPPAADDEGYGRRRGRRYFERPEDGWEEPASKVVKVGGWKESRATPEPTPEPDVDDQEAGGGEGTERGFANGSEEGEEDEGQEMEKASVETDSPFRPLTISPRPANLPPAASAPAPVSSLTASSSLPPRSTTPAAAPPSQPSAPAAAAAPIPVTVPTASASLLSPEDVATIRRAHIIKLEIGEEAYEREVKRMLLGLMKGSGGGGVGG
ncbi:hypothetical protein JCM6882_000638 [Rhodosporidiobolus microsporus]